MGISIQTKETWFTQISKRHFQGFAPGVLQESKLLWNKVEDCSMEMWLFKRIETKVEGNGLFFAKRVCVLMFINGEISHRTPGKRETVEVTKSANKTECLWGVSKALRGKKKKITFYIHIDGSKWAIRTPERDLDLL